MIVMKFGGAALANEVNIRKTAQLVKAHTSFGKIILVVSAMKGVTDELCNIVEMLKEKNVHSALNKISKIKEKHLSTLRLINSGPSGVKSEVQLIRLVSLLENFIRNLQKKEMTQARSDYIVSFGERLSCHLFTEALEKHGLMACPVDSSFLIATTSKFGNALPLYKKSKEYINDIIFPLIKKNVIPVITGFIGFAHDGCTTTLGRGGSDLSAAFLASYLDAQALYLWKDVDGFYTNDPHKDIKAKVINKITYNQAEKLAKKGAKVIYYKALKPVEKKKIPVYIKSFINPNLKGTIIS